MANELLGDLGKIIERLDERGRLVRVRSEVDPVHDLAGVAARLEGRPAAVLFEKVKGHDAPVFTGLYWSRALLADLLDQPERQLPGFVSGCIKRWQQQPMPPVVKAGGPVTEVTENRVDLEKLPVPTHALKDGGPYFDAAVVVAKDPETGVRNASIQRFLVTGRDTMTINIDAGRHLEAYLDKAGQRGETLPFTLNVGVGPGVHFAAATPSEAAPIDTDELGIASEFQGSPLELVAGKTSAVEMIANAMYALECEMVPGEVAPEGPFAEVTGFYAKRAPRPVVHVKAIHHRRAPGLPDHPLRRRGLELGRPARRGERAGPGPAPGAGRQGRLLQPRRLRLLSLHRGHAPGPRRLVEAGDHGDVRGLPAAQDGDRGRRRRRHPQSHGRRVGDDQPARSA